MIEPLVIRGVACPYDGLAIVDGGVHESIAPGAIVPAGAVQLLYGNHDGRPMCCTSDDSLVLWSEPIGLVFEGRIDPAHRYARGMYDAICRGDFDGCSINMMIEDAEEMTVDGVPHRRVTKASVDHVCISNGVAYADTAVWPDAELDDLPPRVRFLRTGLGPRRSATQFGPVCASTADEFERLDAGPLSACRPGRYLFPRSHVRLPRLGARRSGVIPWRPAPSRIP